MTSYSGNQAVRHELTFLNVFRVIQALVYVGLAFTPMGLGWFQLGTLNFAGYVVTFYLLFALLSLALNRRQHGLCDVGSICRAGWSTSLPPCWPFRR